MIYDNIKNYALYEGLRSEFKEVFELIKNNKFERTPGRYELNNGMFYLAQSYESKPEADCFFESHRKFIDLQYIVSGKEYHGIANISFLAPIESYNEEKDIIKYNGTGTNILLDEGYFGIYFPQDGHKPNINAGSKPVKMFKLVFKIPV